MAGISVRVRIRVRDGARISNRVRRRVKLVNYSLITALPIATSADPHIRFLPVAIVRHSDLERLLMAARASSKDTVIRDPEFFSDWPLSFPTFVITEMSSWRVLLY